MAVGNESLGRFELRSTKIETVLGISALAALVAVPVFHAPAALLFLVTGILLAALRPLSTVSNLIGTKAIFILPGFCLLSVLWSLYPGLTIRYALQLLATFVIAVLIARRVPFRTALLATFAALFLSVLLSVLIGSYRSDSGALVGLFGSKNEMAGMAALLALSGFGIATLRDIAPAARALGALGFILGLSAVVLAQSVGALGYLPAAIIAFLAVMLLPKLGLSTRMTGAALGLMLTLLFGVFLVAQFNLFSSAFFDLTGKDFTLTGRIELWQVALNLIAERPFLGTGYQAFWVPGHPPAEALWEAFGIVSRSGFNFHNAYLSNAVEIGLLGLTIEIAVVVLALVLSGRLALQTGSREAALLFAIGSFMTVMTLFEAPVFFQFSLQSALYVMIILYASAALRAAPHH